MILENVVYGLDDTEFESRQGQQDFVLQNMQTGFGDQRASYSVSTENLSWG